MTVVAGLIECVDVKPLEGGLSHKSTNRSQIPCWTVSALWKIKSQKLYKFSQRLMSFDLLCMDKVQSLGRNNTFTYAIKGSSLNLPMTVKDQFCSPINCLPDPTLNSWSSSPFHNNVTDGISAPNDLVSLAWLQKGDIIQIAPLDGEEELPNGFPNSNSSVCPFKSGECTGLGPVPVKDDSSLYTSVSVAPTRISISSSYATFQRPASADYCSPHCSVDSPHLSQTSHLAQANQSGLAKPNYSYTHLIFMAIESTPQKCMTVNQIYNWCESNFPFYKHAGAGWKNSLRHNLSINKSFKRLPRDSRGPGRGAFWTVEPRERPTLLDAIKRNPWNFTNMAALVSAQSDPNGSSSVSLSDFSNHQLFGVRHFGLTQSAPGHLLRAEGLGETRINDMYFDQMGNLIASNVGSGIRLLSSSDGQLVAACESRFLPNGTVESSLANTELDDYHSPTGSLLSNSQNGFSSTTKAPNRAGLPTEWPEEEEERYLRTLSLLAESEDPGSQGSMGGRDPQYQPCESKQNNLDGTLSAEDTKLATKQRRKSRLQPTRFVEDTFPYSADHGVLGTCNECKENAASGCEACHARRLRLLSDPLEDDASFRERAMTDVANTLDSDQEHGPAGGPAARKPSRQTAVAGIHSGITGSGNGAEKVTRKNEQLSEDEPREVYVTPAPYVDHEYSHCQAQLRTPEDNRMVNRFNENYCAEMVRRLSRSRTCSRRATTGKLRGRNVLESFKEEDEADCEETYSIHEYSDESDTSIVQRRHVIKDPRSTELFGFTSISRKRGRYRRRRGASRLSESVRGTVRRDYGKQRFPRSGVRGRRRFVQAYSPPGYSTGHRTRRSKRVIRAPRRPYDDFEESQSNDGYDLLDSNNAGVEVRGAGQVNGFADGRSINFHNGAGDIKYEDAVSVVRSARRGRRGRKRGPVRLSHSYGRSGSEQDFYSGSSSSTSEDDEEARYLKYASQRQQNGHDMELDESSSQSSHSSRSQSYDRSRKSSGVVHLASHPLMLKSHAVARYHPYSVGTVWGQSRMTLARKLPGHTWSNGAFDATDAEEDFLEESGCGLDNEADDEVVEETECANSSERTTVEAAQLLLGISQMQSFRRQSGYLSLDSSGTSTNASEEISTSHPNGPSPISLVPDESEPDLSRSATALSSSSPNPSNSQTPLIID
ncbi:hypothetical protein EG68_04411 [Paragonimus skrjabini miyazakii]|uniref:Fork-head domain-containing protein n=1 Tax=Paragonimus skrjabini miyazakii TaxID=59628 RepID=A0A8S9YV89_9TREM|nr:hypothetical protein EG68_04411 [Paragonimus skrjabini miyazakii]